MTKVEMLEQVRRLRGEGMAPREIARALGVRPSVVTPLVRKIASERGAESGAGVASELVGCWINAGWSKGLIVDESRGWPDDMPPGATETGTSGLVSVLLARRHGWDKVSVCEFLVDVYCLGVKSVRGPSVRDEQWLRRFLPDFYGAYPQGWQDAPIELARHVVLGGVEYARGLGFEPPTNFASAAGHLGVLDGPPAITFGKDGKPFYVSGPRDDARTVVATLERAVGPPPNFDYIVVVANELSGTW